MRAYSSVRENLFFVFLIFTLLEKMRVLAKRSKMCNAPVLYAKDSTSAGLQVFLKFFKVTFYFEIFSLLCGRKKCIPNRLASFVPQLCSKNFLKSRIAG